MSESPKDDPANKPKAKKAAKKSAKKAAKKKVKVETPQPKSEEQSPELSLELKDDQLTPKVEKTALTQEESTDSNRRKNRRGERSRKHSSPKVEINQEEVAKKAWKIFSGEVIEEGLALIDDREARDKALRAFKVAEVFVIEKERRQLRDTRETKNQES